MEISSQAGASRTPVVILTGFLGAGKTTFLKTLLHKAAEEGKRVAVLENEIGEIGIDNRLLGDAAELLVAPNGCLCHTLREDLVGHLLKLAESSFDLVVIETTGRADPEPVRRTIVHDEQLKGLYRLIGILTIIDAKHLARHIGEHECRAQIASADCVAINKIDGRRPEEIASVERTVREINPLLSRLWRMQDGQVIAREGQQADEIFQLLLENSDALSSPRDHAHEHGDSCRLEGDRHHCDEEHHHLRAHDDGVSAVSIKVSGVLDKKLFDQWVQNLRIHGADIFRAKGLVSIAGEGTILVQAIHYDWTAVAWSHEQNGTEFVIIGRKLDAQALSKGLSECQLVMYLDPMSSGETVLHAPAPFEPPEFYSPPDDCPICPARAAMQLSFEEHGAALERFQAALDELPFSGLPVDRDSFVTAQQLVRVHQRSFVAMVTAYYRSFVLNQAMYYLLETNGRQRKDCQEAVMAAIAYERYRENALQAVERMKSVFDKGLKPACALLNLPPESAAFRAFSRLLETHALLEEKIRVCWTAMDGYTQQRKESILTLF